MCVCVFDIPDLLNQQRKKNQRIVNTRIYLSFYYDDLCSILLEISEHKRNLYTQLLNQFPMTPNLFSNDYSYDDVIIFVVFFQYCFYVDL